MRGIIAWAIVCCAVLFSVAAAEAREVSGVNMPDTVSVDGRELRLNGIGVGKKFFFKVYVVGLYLEMPTHDAQVALRTDEGKRIVLSMLRNVSRDEFVHAVETGVMRNSGPEMPALRARLDLLEKALPPLTKGNVIEFTYVPGKGTLMRGQGRELTIPGKDFADALFSVWLGPKATNEGLKRELLKAPG